MPQEELFQDDDLGGGLTEEELYFWALRKRRQNLEHYKRATEAHPPCPTCKNCLCGRKLPDDQGFRCVCGAGLIFITPYRLRLRTQRAKIERFTKDDYSWA